MPQRIEVNVQTGERKVIELTPEEIADAQSRKAAEDAANAARPKVLTLDGVEALLKKAGVSAADIEAAKR